MCSVEEDLNPDQIQCSVEVMVEVTVLEYVTVVVDKSDRNWREKAVREGERQASSQVKGEVVMTSGEITDE